MSSSYERSRVREGKSVRNLAFLLLGTFVGLRIVFAANLVVAQQSAEPPRDYQGVLSRATARSVESFHASLPTDPRVLLVVEENLYLQVQAALTTYSADLATEGYSVSLSTVSATAAPPEVRALLAAEYAVGDLVGAVLIGDISAAYTAIHTGNFSNPSAWEVWISLDAYDMYYMDLDGYYEHVDQPDLPGTVPPHVAQVLLYDSCTTFIDEYIVYMGGYQYRWGTYNEITDHGQFAPEIWVARIMGHSLALETGGIPLTEAEVINDYFASNHALRQHQWGVIDAARLCDAIAGDGPSHGMSFTGVFHETTEHGLVTEVEYVNMLHATEGSKVMLLTSHSAPQRHHFADGILWVSELDETAKSSVFYILNACSSCRWDQHVSEPANPNYLGGVYVFDKSLARDAGQAAIGFTGVGGFNFLENFSSYLQVQPDATYGDAYRYFFETYLTLIFGPLNYVYLGDPTIGPSYGNLLFSDGFESGDTTLWSNTVP